MFILYDLIFLVFIVFYLPIYLFRRKFHPGFQARLGIIPAGLRLNNPIWIHAVSVGEMMAAKNLIRDLKAAYPDKRFFITTVTPTGNKIAKGFSGEDDYVSYLPLDLSFIVKNVVDKIKPSLFIMLETEIWPNLISRLYQKDIPVILLNGRLSDHSFKGYLSIKFLLEPLLNKINLFCAQTKNDAERFSRLGVSKDRIRITGNMKFDNADYSDKKITGCSDKYKAMLGLAEKDSLWVCGSTHPGEEEIILGVYKELIKEFPRLKLLIAPRHPERSKKIENLVSGSGLRPALISLSQEKACGCGHRCVYILDMVGELMNFYNIADIVFVGGSLIKKGGHNILEPAMFGKPVIFGPYMFNFRDIAALFVEKGACIMAADTHGLYLGAKDLLSNPEKANRLSLRAREIISENRGATARNLEYIKSYFS